MQFTTNLRLRLGIILAKPADFEIYHISKTIQPLWHEFLLLVLFSP